MKVIPTLDNIYVRPLEDVSGAAYIPPNFRRKNQTVVKGEAVLCGPNAIVTEGDVLVLNKWEDNKINLNGEDLLIIKPHSIIAVK